MLCAPPLCPTPVFRVLLLILLASVALPAAAQSAIHRCASPDGQPVYTDQPCETLGARSLEPPRTPASSAGAPASGRVDVLCAADFDALKRAVANAFASRDPNRVGGLILWNGLGSDGVVTTIKTLEPAVRQPILSMDGDAAAGLDVVTAPPTGTGTRRLHFAVAKDSGCLWLRPPAA